MGEGKSDISICVSLEMFKKKEVDSEVLHSHLGLEMAISVDQLTLFLPCQILQNLKKILKKLYRAPTSFKRHLSNASQVIAQMNKVIVKFKKTCKLQDSK